MMLSASLSERPRRPARLPMQAQGWCQFTNHRPQRYSRRTVDIHASKPSLIRARIALERHRNAMANSKTPTNGMSVRNDRPRIGSVNVNARAGPSALSTLASPVVIRASAADIRNQCTYQGLTTPFLRVPRWGILGPPKMALDVAFTLCNSTLDLAKKQGTRRYKCGIAARGHRNKCASCRESVDIAE